MSDSFRAFFSRQSLAALFRQGTTFLLVGGVGVVIDIVVFNALRTTVLTPSVVHGGPVIAKLISSTLAIIVSWIGNRLWTFREQRRTDVVAQALEYAAVSIAGLLIAIGCLWISHYVLGFTSVIADNFATNVVGLALGTAFRFALYRFWVFSPKRAATAVARADELSARQAATSLTSANSLDYVEG